MSTKPRVFIIESLRFSDENDDWYEGALLRKILSLSGSEAKYIYLRTKQEFEEAIDQFEDSSFRYLHISCHGSAKGIELTLDYIPFEELGEMLSPCLENRRVFFSSCKVMNENLAEALLKGTGCYSVIGPSKDINIDRLAAFWSSFYHLTLRDEAKAMNHKQVARHTAILQKVFSVHMRYFSRSKSAENGFKEVKLEELPGPLLGKSS